IKEKKSVQYLAVLPGEKLKIFTLTATNGVIILNDTLQHKINIIVKDVYGNSTYLKFVIQSEAISEVDSFPSHSQPLLPNQENNVEGRGVKAFFTRNAFYDVVPFVLTEIANPNKNSASLLVALHNNTVPVHDAYTVKLKTSLAANDPLRKNVVMQLISGNSKQIAKGQWSGDWMSAMFNKLGYVQLLIDTVAPKI